MASTRHRSSHRIGRLRFIFVSCLVLILSICIHAVDSIQLSIPRRPFLYMLMALASAFDAAPVKRCRLIALADPNDSANSPLLDNKDSIPDLDILAVGTSLADLDIESLRTQQPNAIFVAGPNAREPLAALLEALPSIEWIHTRSAGIDHVTSPVLSARSSQIVMTNAKGLFSSTLAEYSLMACAYFAKDLPRILQQQRNKNWTKFPIRELRGATMGIVGYGDIGAATARLAKAYGMRIVGLKRSRRASDDNDDVKLCDKMYYMEDNANAVVELFGECDFIVCAAPLTEQTRQMISQTAFENAKPGAVFINVGRGEIVDEQAMIQALESGQLRGAGLDVVATEPLPKDSRLWELENVLLSPHNMDMTETFMHESTEWFVTNNIPRFVRALELQNRVDPTAGY